MLSNTEKGSDKTETRTDYICEKHVWYSYRDSDREWQEDGKKVIIVSAICWMVYIAHQWCYHVLSQSAESGSMVNMNGDDKWMSEWHLVEVWCHYTPPCSEEDHGWGGMVIVRHGSSCSSGLLAFPVLHTIHFSRASHSSSSSVSNQRSPSGPSPLHLTRYWVLQPFLHSSTIFSMKNSFAPSMLVGGVHVWGIGCHCFLRTVWLWRCGILGTDVIVLVGPRLLWSGVC